MLGRPSRLKDRTPPTKLEIPFGHAFDRCEVSSSKRAVRRRPVGSFAPLVCVYFGDCSPSCVARSSIQRKPRFQSVRAIRRARN